MSDYSGGDDKPYNPLAAVQAKQSPPAPAVRFAREGDLQGDLQARWYESLIAPSTTEGRQLLPHSFTYRARCMISGRHSNLRHCTCAHPRGIPGAAIARGSGTLVPCAAVGAGPLQDMWATPPTSGLDGPTSQS